ncbi:hypothetical protein I6E56_11135 [Salinibacterium sp. NK8237]|nr:hypothetical protein [Salinibacterium sp. NK8237]
MRTTRDFDLAEDTLADAAERALHKWPDDGVPANPGAWLTTVATRRAVDLLRRSSLERRKIAEVHADNSASDADSLDDDRLRLIFVCCHPALALESRVALTLKVVAGLPTEAIARAFLVSEPTMSQRLLRAKQKIANAGIPYREPGPENLADRLDAVLSVVYLIFTDGYGSHASMLAEEALRLARLLAELMPRSDEVRCLVALLLLQHSRRFSRLVNGEPVTLELQDRSRWDADMVTEACKLLLQRPEHARGPYRLQAELAAAHATASTADATDWSTIVALYDELLGISASPIVQLNRAVAVGLCNGPTAGLAALEDIASHPRLVGQHLIPAVRGDLLARAGLVNEAVVALREAASLAKTDHERRALSRRARELEANR